MCIDSENFMATAEQMQERETQLQFESAPSQTAEQERSTLIQNLGAMRTKRGHAMVDIKEIGQSFMSKRGADDDFGEWTHKVRTFMHARFRDEILTALTWAARQRKIVVKTCIVSQRNRFVPWITVIGEQAAEDEMDNIDDFVGNSMDTLCPLQARQPTGSFGTLEKEMAWKLGDDCTVNTTRRRP